MHKAVEHASFGWQDSKATCAHAYLFPKLLQLITGLSAGKSLRILDLGCGNGYVASRLAELGHRVMGVDISPDGIEIAHRFYPWVDFRVMSIYDEHLPEAVGEVDCVISLEVVEHLFYPQRLLAVYRKPLFEKLAASPGLSLSVLAGQPLHGEEVKIPGGC